MKKAILFSLVSSGILLLAGCNEEWNTGIGTQGSFNPVVSLDANPLSSRAGRSDASVIITAEDLHLKLTPDDPKGVKREWESLSDFNVEEKFNVGGYTLEAYYGEKNKDGFDSPYYYGAATFSVRENETTPVSLTATLGNAMVSTTYTEAFVNYFTNYSVDVNTVMGNKITCSAKETRPVYVTPGSVQLMVNVVKPNGNAATYQAVAFAAEARHHYHITLDVNNGNVGEAFLTISFDDQLDMENVVIDLSDELQNVAAPTIKSEGFASGEPVTIVTGSTAENPIKFVVSAQGGLASVMLETKSTSLKEQGWPEKVDLLAVPAAIQATMASLGFSEIGLWHNPDRMALIDFSNVLPAIGYIEGATNESTFTLTVTDRVAQTCEQPVTLAVNVERLNVEIVSHETLPCYEGETTFELAYNGIDPQNRIGVQYLNVNGSWANLEVVSIAEKSRANSLYTVKVSGLPTDVVNGERDVTLRAFAKDASGAIVQKSTEVVIERQKVPFSMSVDERNVFAYKATGVVAHESEAVADFASRAKLEISTDGGENYSEYTFAITDGNRIAIEGLEPATNYTARLKADGMTCRPVEFATEAVVQLPNSGMEEWYSENGSSSNQKWFYPWAQGAADAAWNTYNPVTMSQGGSGTAGYAYKATSGTVFTADAHSGSSAAQIRTVGWGSSNSASANPFNRWAFGTCKYVSAGQLFLGNWNNVEAIKDATPNYGMEFASRPSSLSFWYKYAVMNKDGNDNGQKGVAIVKILDAQGGVIAEQNMLLDRNADYNDRGADKDYSVNGSYAEKVVNFNYPFDTNKAKSIQVIFKSTNYTSDELEANKNQNHMRPPKPMNLNDHEYLGSSLLIDDITLNF